MTIPQFPRRKPGAAFRAVDETGGLVVLPDQSEIKVLNPAGSLIFSLLDGRHSREQIVEAIVDEFDVTPARAREDLEQFLGSLEAEGMLAAAEEPEATA